MLIDLGSGRVMWSSNATRILPIASLTKMMNALVAQASGGPSTPVTITGSDTSIGGSTVGVLPAGKSMPLDDLLAGMLVVSGNDAALALADGLGPGRARFVEKMNARAKAMGLTCTHFVTPTGLSSDDRSCARDVASMAAAVISVPRLARIVRKAWDTIPIPGSKKPAKLRNRNPLLQSKYPGVDGVKTGHTTPAGWCLAATATRSGNRRLLGVLLHSPDTGVQMRKLLDLGFQRLAG
jgi:D-alanyl-D-alanine carboxypeptidase